MRWRNGLLTASSALLLAGCGGEARRAAPPPPRIPADVASKLATDADQVAALTPGTCEARDAAERFRGDVIDSIGRVPARYRETLTSAANSLATRLETCVEPQPPKKHKGKHGHGHHEKDD